LCSNFLRTLYVSADADAFLSLINVYAVKGAVANGTVYPGYCVGGDTIMYVFPNSANLLFSVTLTVTGGDANLYIKTGAGQFPSYTDFSQQSLNVGNDFLAVTTEDTLNVGVDCPTTVPMGYYTLSVTSGPAPTSAPTVASNHKSDAFLLEPSMRLVLFLTFLLTLVF